jgi:hypothetical protein
MQVGKWMREANKGRAMAFKVVKQGEKRTQTSCYSGAHCALI